MAAQRQRHDEPTGIVLVGAGYWGMNYIRVLNELIDAKVVTVCDARPARLDEVRRRFPTVSVTTDVEEAVTSSEAQAVVIATSAETHRRLADLALRAGKHVLVEKPLATTSQDAEELSLLADEAGKILLVGHTFLYNPAVRAIKGYLQAGEIGSTYYLYARRTSLGPIRSDVNAIWDLAPHDVAIFMYLLDVEPSWVSAVGARVLRNSREDVGFITLGFPSGVIGHIHVSWADANKVREVVVVGSDKRIVFNDLNALERVRIFDKGVKAVNAEEPPSFGEYVLQLRDGSIMSPLVPTLEPLKNQCGHFVHCIRRGDTPLTNGAQGQSVVRVMEAVTASMERRGVPTAVVASDLFEEAVSELTRPVR